MRGETGILDPTYVKYLNARIKPKMTYVVKADNSLISWELRLADSEEDAIIVSSKQFGGKAGKHCYDFGLDPSKEEDRQRFLDIISDIVVNHDEHLQGDWHMQEGVCDYFIKGSDVVVTNHGEYVTTLKDGVNNARIKNARKRKI